MDARAELTLHLARMLQERYAPPRSPTVWSLAPEIGSASFPEMVALLSATPKPCLVAPLVEPGALGLWTKATMSENGRTVLAREVANGAAYFAEKIRICNINHSDRIRLGVDDTAFSISVADFLKWATEYAIAGASLSVAKASEGFGQILIRPPGRLSGPSVSAPLLSDTPRIR